jgi:hypothetical protein
MDPAVSLTDVFDVEETGERLDFRDCVWTQLVHYVVEQT